MPGSLAAKRYILLTHQMQANKALYKSQKDIGDKLGIDQSSVSKVRSGERGVSLEMIELAIKSLKISPMYFFGHFTREPHYLEFVGPHSMQPPKGYGAMVDFLDLARERGWAVSPAEEDAIRRQEWDGEPTEETYYIFLQALRTLRREDTSVRKPGSIRKRA